MIRRVAGQLTHKGRPQKRTAGVFTCVLVVLLLVGMLCVQTTQTLLIIRRSDMERAKLYQAREVIELGRQIDWNLRPANSVKLVIPQSVTQDSVTQDLAPDKMLAEIEGMRSDATTMEVERIVVHYPIEHPGKITATWERNHE